MMNFRCSSGAVYFVVTSSLVPGRSCAESSSRCNFDGDNPSCKYLNPSITAVSMQQVVASAALEVLALDRGPRIGNIAECLRGGFSTAGTACVRFGAMRRLSDRFEGLVSWGEEPWSG